MDTRFPTKPTTRTSHLGEPERARSCWCGPRAVVEDGGCIRCGHWIAPVIARTFGEQQARLERSAAELYPPEPRLGRSRKHAPPPELELVA